MNDLTCIIIGGGHAGLGALKAIKEESQGLEDGRRIRFVLIDKQPGHVRKVMLFRPAASGEEIMVPWTRYCSDGAEFLQSTVTYIDHEAKGIQYTDAQGNDVRIHYDLLVVAVGSIVRRPDPDRGGIALTDPQVAADIRDRWRANLRKAAVETNPEERKRLMTIAVAGAGISGIETSAELVLAMRKEAEALGLNLSDISVYLLNANEGLFLGGPEKVRRKLEMMLGEYGVTVLHNHKVMREQAGVLTLRNNNPLPVGLCIWTIGLIPNPALRSMGLPLTSEGQVLVDECYRVQGMSGVYSIGDCARIVDPSTGKADQMTCKEAGPQALRLGKIVMADLEGRPAPVHKSFLETFGFGLGQNRGLVWIRKWGLDIMITGKLAWKVKKVGWDFASWLR
ncbi:NADH dehydrogenase [Paenibacillus sp. J31TS4]|uniref:NAD(P)/FAD-dependent oxidoreductase n=1 Tax=Paenibacillus sp. J31TS4 TaxID=2807195 RepID=UPI001B2B1E30|nr:FAD-dependent oxidoreductase [Paenibacillus sp. J31TS4]GIP37054.1 NADH dehydrogenase [Paenibacillus sp. J31TS4]